MRNEYLNRQAITPRWASRGMTLTEVMVALVVFSIGLLGLASLQFSGARHGHNARLRAIAMTRAETMVDQMRANAGGLAAGTYDTTDDGMPGPASVVRDCADSSAQCSSAELARYHLKLWRVGPGNGLAAASDGLGLDNLLPAGDGRVCLDATPASWDCDGAGPVYAVKVRWAERDIEQGDRSDASDDGMRQRTVTLLTQPLG